MLTSIERHQRVRHYCTHARWLQSSDRKPAAADEENEEPEEDPIEKLARELDFSKEQVEGTSQLMTLRLTTNDGAVP